MDIYETLSRNVKQLKKATGLKSAKAVADLSKNKGAGIDRSYVAELITDKENKKIVNLSMSKLEALADTFDVDVWQLLHPLGFNEQGKSTTASSDIDINSMVEAVRYATIACKEAEIDDDEFFARAIALTYIAKLKGDEAMLSIELMKLVKQY